MVEPPSVSQIIADVLNEAAPSRRQSGVSMGVLAWAQRV